MFFLLLPYSIVQDIILPAQHQSRGFGSRKQYFSSNKMTPLYVKQFPLVDILCTVLQKVSKILIKLGSLQLKTPPPHTPKFSNDLNTENNFGFSK